MNTRSSCPVCGNTSHSLFLPERFHAARVTELSFGSRKEPEFMNFELVECTQCQLVYAKSVDEKAILKAYADAAFDSPVEAEFAAMAYASHLSLHWSAPSGGHALEVGTGSGTFLSQLKRIGFDQVVGIEPSESAANAAMPDIRGNIRIEPFTRDRFVDDQFDFACCFQTLEHVADPVTVVRDMTSLVKPGGAVALVVHDRSAWLNRLLGRFSPIIDIEHLQLYNARSLKVLASQCGLDVVSCSTFKNIYPVSYWLKLLPLPSFIKAPLRKLAKAVGDPALGFNVGNTFMIGVKR